MKRKIGKINLPHTTEVQRRVRLADNCIQHFVEELVEVGKIKVWKIAKVRYSHERARKAMEALNVSH